MRSFRFEEGVVALSEELLEIIVCPKCKGSLELAGGGGAASAGTDGGLVCKRCRVRYPVEDDIPVLMVSAAVPLD